MDHFRERRRRIGASAADRRIVDCARRAMGSSTTRGPGLGTPLWRRMTGRNKALTELLSGLPDDPLTSDRLERIRGLRAEEGMDAARPSQGRDWAPPIARRSRQRHSSGGASKNRNRTGTGNHGLKLGTMERSGSTGAGRHP